MKTLNDFNFKNKKVLVRCDFNVPLDENSNILDDFRIKKSIPTIEYLVKRKAKVILIAHLDRPGGEVVEGLRLTSVQKRLMEYLDLPVAKVQDCIGKDVENYVAKMKEGDVLLLENLRFYKGEESNDDNFSKKLADLADIYVNDAFSACHRAHASVVGVTKYLPSAAGLLLEKEIKILSRLLENPWRPLVVIIGGAKVADKIGVISQFLDKADHLLLGGKIANTILQAKGVIVGKPLLDKDLLKKIEKIDTTSPKIHFPVDGVIASESILEEGKRNPVLLKTKKGEYFRIGGFGSIKKEESVFDIGPETIKVFSEIIKSAKMILWSGPLGMFEEKSFEKGTKDVAEVITRNHSAFKVAGGGDTNLALSKFGLIDKFDHTSTGGGAMLDFLSNKKLPGIEALK
jgi:phosphoglycerate kinase